MIDHTYKQSAIKTTESLYTIKGVMHTRRERPSWWLPGVR